MRKPTQEKNKTLYETALDWWGWFQWKNAPQIATTACCFIGACFVIRDISNLFSGEVPTQDDTDFEFKPRAGESTFNSRSFSFGGRQLVSLPSLDINNQDMVFNLVNSTETPSVNAELYSFLPEAAITYNGINCSSTGTFGLPGWLALNDQTTSIVYDAGLPVMDVELVDKATLIAIYNGEVRFINKTTGAYLNTQSTTGGTYNVVSNSAGTVGYSASNAPGIYSFTIDPNSPSQLDNLGGLGNAQAICLSGDGNTAYVGTETGDFRALNIQTPTSLSLIGSLPALGGSSFSTKLLTDDTVMMSASGQGVHFVNVENSASPSLRTTVNTPGTAYDTAVETEGMYKFVYVADDTSLRVLNATDKNNPYEISATPTPGGASGVFFDNQNKLLHVAQGTEGYVLYRRNATNALERRATYPLPFARRVQYSNSLHTAYVAGGFTSNLLHMIRRKASLTGQTTTAITTHPYSITCQAAPQTGSVDSVTFTIAFNTPVENSGPIPDQSILFNQNTVIPLNMFSKQDGSSFVFHGPFDASGNTPPWLTLQVTPTQVGSTTMAGTAQSIAVSSLDGTAYATTGTQFHAFFTADPTTAQPIGTLATDGAVAARGGNFVILTHPDGSLSFIGLDNPASPSLKNSLSTPGNAKDAALLPSNIAVVADDSAGVTSIDADPENPSVRDTLVVGGSALGIVATTNEEAVVQTSTGLAFVDATNANNLLLDSTYTTAAVPQDIAANEQTAFVSLGTSVEVVDFSNPSSPQQRAIINVAANRVALWGDHTLVAVTQNSVEIFDVSNPGAPVYRGSFAGNNIGDVDTSKRLVYFSDDNGLHVLRLDTWEMHAQPTTQSAPITNLYLNVTGNNDDTASSNTFAFEVQLPLTVKNPISDKVFVAGELEQFTLPGADEIFESPNGHPLNTISVQMPPYVVTVSNNILFFAVPGDQYVGSPQNAYITAADAYSGLNTTTSFQMAVGFIPKPKPGIDLTLFFDINGGNQTQMIPADTLLVNGQVDPLMTYVIKLGGGSPVAWLATQGRELFFYPGGLSPSQTTAKTTFAVSGTALVPGGTGSSTLTGETGSFVITAQRQESKLELLREAVDKLSVDVEQQFRRTIVDLVPGVMTAPKGVEIVLSADGAPSWLNMHVVESGDKKSVVLTGKPPRSEAAVLGVGSFFGERLRSFSIKGEKQVGGVIQKDGVIRTKVEMGIKGTSYYVIFLSVIISARLVPPLAVRFSAWLYNRWKQRKPPKNLGRSFLEHPLDQPVSRVEVSNYKKPEGSWRRFLFCFFNGRTKRPGLPEGVIATPSADQTGIIGLERLAAKQIKELALKIRNLEQKDRSAGLTNAEKVLLEYFRLEHNAKLDEVFNSHGQEETYSVCYDLMKAHRFLFLTWETLASQILETNAEEEEGFRAEGQALLSAENGKQGDPDTLEGKENPIFTAEGRDIELQVVPKDSPHSADAAGVGIFVSPRKAANNPVAGPAQLVPDSSNSSYSA